ncbi:Protein of unknown function (DUF3752) domain containing protein [Rhypophila decipiens]
MASIGPQLPPHLQKRKRTPEDDASPPAKVLRQDNNDEISLDDGDSDDGFGPGAPVSKGPSIKPSITPSIGPSLPPTTASPVAKPPAPSTSRSIGPTMPPAQATNNEEIALDLASDSESVGPAAPAPAKTNIGPSLPPSAPRRVLGPAPPPAPLSERPTTDPNSDSDSDSDDGWGPALPSATSTNRNIPVPSTAPVSQQSSAPKRDDWMIAPPTDNNFRAPDPTKLKARGFASGPRASTDKSGGVSSIWTETPEQKLQRLTNAVLGREEAESSAAPVESRSSAATSRRVDEERIKAFTEQTRGRSLVEEHQASKASGKAAKLVTASGKWGQPAEGGGPPGEEEGDDDPSMRPFDREKDMAIGGRLSNVKKREIMKSAANFGGRFQKGSYL